MKLLAKQPDNDRTIRSKDWTGVLPWKQILSLYTEEPVTVTRQRPNFEPSIACEDYASFEDFSSLLNGKGRVEYGAGIDATFYTEACSKYQWRANNVTSPLLFNDFFKNVPNLHQSIYFGEAISVFAAHTEEADPWSVNYLHSGAPKEWTVTWPSALDSLYDVITAACRGIMVLFSTFTCTYKNNFMVCITLARTVTVCVGCFRKSQT